MPISIYGRITLAHLVFSDPMRDAIFSSEFQKKIFPFELGSLLRDHHFWFILSQPYSIQMYHCEQPQHCHEYLFHSLLFVTALMQKEEISIARLYRRKNI